MGMITLLFMCVCVCVCLWGGGGGIKDARAIVLYLPTLRASLSGTRFPAPSSRR